VEVAIEADGQVVAKGIADIVRDALAAAEIGDGAHGFAIPLPEILHASAHVRLVALVGPEQLTLPKSPSFWQTAKPGSLWSAVRFSYGREGDPESDADTPIEVPPPPEPAPPRALVGRDGWLFDAGELDSISDPSAAELDLLADELRRIAVACAELGVVYIPAVVPRKLEAVGDHSKLVTESERPWLDRLRTRLRDVDEVEMLDLLPVLADARRHGPCFHRSDPDWNDRGAFFVVRALIKEAAKHAPALRPPQLSDLHLTSRPGYRGVLADAPKSSVDGRALGPAESDFIGEEGVEIDASQLGAQRMPVERHLTGADVHVRLLSQPDGGISPRVSIVGDGACLPLLPWLAETAKRATFFWAPAPPMEPVELELPDALLHVIRYRDLHRLPIDQSM
jgi:hypothetical protein